MTVPFDIAPKTPSSPFEHLRHIWTVRQHRDDVFAPPCATFAGDVAAVAPALDQFIDRPAAAAVDNDGKALLQEIAGHGLAHQPKTDESDGVRHELSE